MAGRIYVRKDGDDGAYVELQGRPYDSEYLLQDLLARHPDLLAGDHDGDPPRWLFVSREMGVPDARGRNGQKPDSRVTISRPNHHRPALSQSVTHRNSLLSAPPSANNP